MLLKLFKYDFKNVAKIGLPISLVMLLTSGLASISVLFFFATFETENEILAETVSAVCLFMMLTWVIAIIAYNIGITIIIVYRYYSHFFTDQGYLTFTLPCKVSTHFSSKILNGVLWKLISSVVTVGSALIVVLGLSNATFINDYTFKYLFFEAFSGMFEVMYVSFIQEIIASVISSISGLLILYIAVTIGAMVANKHKVLASIGFYFAISWGFSLIETLAKLIPQFIVFSNIDDFIEYEKMLEVSGWITTGITLGLHLTAIVVFYLLNRRFLNKKLNLA